MIQCYGNPHEVSAVMGAVRPLYYATVNVAGSPVEAMVDSRSAAMILLFSLFRTVGKQAAIQSSVLQVPKVVLHDYSSRSIPISAEVQMR